MKQHLPLERRAMLRAPQAAGALRPPRGAPARQQRRQARARGSTEALGAGLGEEQQLLEARRQSSQAASTSAAPAEHEPAAAPRAPQAAETPPVQVCQCVTLAAETTHEAAVAALKAALREHAGRHRACSSGVLRLEVPLPPAATALQWLKAQQQQQQQLQQQQQEGGGEAPGEPGIYFSPRRSSAPATAGTRAAGELSAGSGAVAGWGAAWAWQGRPGQALGEAAMAGVRAFLSPRAPRVRALGGCRFDCSAAPAPEWEAFGSYFLMLPRLEYAEAAACHTLACTLAWHAGAGGGGCGSLADAAQQALQALARVRPPSAAAAPALKVERRGLRHSPDAPAWRGAMARAERLLREPGRAHALPLGEVDPAAARLEYESNGQGGLDALLAALEQHTEVYSSLDDSELTKVVLARRSDVRHGGRLQPAELLQTLQERDPRAFQLLLQLPCGAAFLASTPELLFERSGRRVASEAVAGTRRRGPAGNVERDFWLAFDLLRSPKDHAEFTLVRDWIRDALSGVCSAVRVDTEKSVLKQGAVQHLYGRLSGELHPQCSDAHLLAALHPTPAVCGRPRQAARELLGRLEPFDRGFYAGPFGWVSGGGSEWAVAIRSALVHPPAQEARGGGGQEGLVSLFAGVGIVRGSQPESEWQELDLKARQFEALLREPPPLASAPNANALWAGLLVEELCRLGVNTFAIAPGSRSSPLTAAAARHPTARVVSCIDERSLAFWALGYGRACGRPAAVVTSSGTAVANLLPAVVEASESRVPLLLLTADRPGELRQTAANQTIDQVKMFGGYTRWAADVQPPSGEVPARVALTTVDAAVRWAASPAPGPVHLNCQFREPLGTAPAPWPTSALQGLEAWERGSAPSTAPLGPQPAAGGEPLARLLARLAGRRGLVVVGEQLRAEDSLACLQLARALGWPLVADVLSGLSVGAQQQPGVTLLRHLDLLLLDRAGCAWDALRPQAVLQLGGRLTSKRTAQFLEWAALEHGAEWLFVGEGPERHDAAHCVTHRLQMSPAQLAAALQPSP